MLHSKNRLASLLVLLLCGGCVDDLPPLVPYVDLGGAGGGGADRGMTTPDGGPGIDQGDRDDGAERLDMASNDDMDAIDAMPFDDSGMGSDLAGADFGALDFGSDADDLGLDDFQVPDLEPLDMAPPLDQSPPEPDMAPPPPELCNGEDEDLDGVVDEDYACGRVVSERCRLYFGFADFYGGPSSTADSFGDCPGRDDDNFGLAQCVGTRRDARFRRLEVANGDEVNGDNRVALALRCDGGPVTEWIQSHCRAYLGQGDSGAGEELDGSPTWGPCPGEPGGNGDLQCISTSGDGRFHPMLLKGRLDDNDSFGLAFDCQPDEGDRGRAASVAASAAFVFAWANSGNNGAVDEGQDWVRGCPGENGVGSFDGPGYGCASTSFDGLFHRFRISEDVGGDDAFGIALIPHPDAPPPPPPPE